MTATTNHLLLVGLHSRVRRWASAIWSGVMRSAMLSRFSRAVSFPVLAA